MSASIGKLPRSIPIITIVVLLALVAAPAGAHVGSPDVFYEGAAGPYRLFVTVRLPQVVPGVADIEIRSASNDVREIRTTVTRLAGAGSRYAPVPDIAHRSTVDPRFFASSLWLMELGALQVRLVVDGTQGEATMSVPVASFAQKTLAMPKGLGVLLLVLAIGLAAAAISIVGAAAREAKLDPGSAVPLERRRAGRMAMTVTGAVVVAIFCFAFAWWSSDASSFAAMADSFKPPPVAVTVEKNCLVVRATDRLWQKYVTPDQLIPDHGHLMHLFLVRTSGMDQMYHLHPQMIGNATFAEASPAIAAGHYQVFADVVLKSGFPRTLVGTSDLPSVPDAPFVGDDSGASSVALSTASEDTSRAVLPDGTQMVWERDGPLEANVPMIMRFRIEDRHGQPAGDVEPYMGMAAHAEIVRSDFSVFAHIHPSGSVPMAMLMLAGANSAAVGLSMPMDNMTDMKLPVEQISPELSLPYGFPQPGLYRLFVQFKRAGRVETAAFNAHVR